MSTLYQTDSKEVGHVLGQGTAGAALCSQLNLDHGLHSNYRGVRCEYFAYQDDVGKPSDGVAEAQAENVKMSHSVSRRVSCPEEDL